MYSKSATARCLTKTSKICSNTQDIHLYLLSENTECDLNLLIYVYFYFDTVS